MIGIVAMEACLFGGVELVANKAFEVGPSLFCGRAIVPLLAFFKVQSGFEDKSVGNVEKLFGGVWLTIFGVVLSIFNLLDETVEGTVGVPIRSHFGVVVFEFQGCDVSVVFEEVVQDGMNCLVHVANMAIFEGTDVDVVDC